MANERVVYMEDLEKRKEVYGICEECNESGTGWEWCQPCNAKRFKENFKNWTSGNKNIDEFHNLMLCSIQIALNGYLLKIFKMLLILPEAVFSKIYSAIWPEGYIHHWDIENQKWERGLNRKVALKSLDNSSDISEDFLNEVMKNFILL